MSLIRDPATITKVGRQMMTAGGDITYTKATLYGQDISHLTKDQLESLTSIGSALMTVPVGISDKSVNGSATTIVLEATFQNSNLKADLPYTAVGFFAKKGDDEKLVLVGVADPGAYLVATPPDGIATDALDIKVAISIGDAASVTAVVDPAGSVTPATLNGAISKATHDLTAQINTKADDAATKKALDTKANKSDVTASLATKANSADVDSKIAGVNKSISDVSDTVKANKDATDQALATKADKTDVAKDIDTVNKSISSMSVTITANQKATDTALDTKADKTTVNQELATKANSSDVDKKLDEKADKSSVDAKINAIDFSKIKFRKQYLTKSGIPSDKTWNATKNSDGSYTIDIYQDDWTAYNVASLLQAITTKADQSSLDATNKTVATKANSSDVYTKKQVDDAFSSRDATIATKADKATVDAEISKIDFTPYAKTADVNKEIKTVTDLANSKVDANYSYSKAELDKKLLALSTDTSGKVNADQVSQMIADKADKVDVTKQIKTVTDLANSKVDATYSYSKAELDKKLLAVTTTADGKVGADQVAQMIAGKADKTYVDNQIATIDFGKIKFRKQYVNSDGQTADKTWSATKNKDGTYTIDLWQDDWTASKLYGVLAQLPNKADTSTVNAQIADVKNTGKQAQATADSALAGYNKRPVISGGASDDLLSFKTTQLRYYPGNGNTCKNLPPATNQQWFTVEYIFENPNGDGIAIYRSPANEIWTIGNNGGYYDQGWVKVANANDIQGLQNQVNTKLASGDLPTELQKITFRKQYVDGSNKLQDGHWKLVKQADGSYLVDLYHDDWTAQRVADLLNQIGSKADTATVNSQVADAKNAATKAQTTADNANDNANGRLSLNGGTMGSTAQISFADSGTWTWGTSNKPAGKRGGLRWDGQSDSAEIYADEDGSDNLDLVFQIGDDGSNHFSFRNQVGAEVAAIQSNGHYTGTIDWASVNGRPDVATHADVNNKVNVQGDLFRLATAGNTWVDILGVANSDTPVLVSIRDQGSGNLLGNYAAAIAFGGGDTKGVLNVAYSDHTARIIGGNGNAPVWHEDIAWKSDISNLQNIINQQNQTIQSLTTRLANAENEIRYIKANYVEGRTFPASQEAQANSWENENPQRIAFITK